MKLRVTHDETSPTPQARSGAAGSNSSCFMGCESFTRGFTLIELILVLALLVVITSIAAPAMSKFIRGRALDTEARRFFSLTHIAQSRAVSDGLPVLVWINQAAGSYGLSEETTSPTGDPKAEDLMLDSTLAIAVQNSSLGAPTMFNNLPAIRFLPDGTIDENSPTTVKLTDSDGFARWLTETPLRTGYEVSSTGN